MVSASARFSGPEYYDNLMGPLWFDPFAVDLAQRERSIHQRTRR